MRKKKILFYTLMLLPLALTLISLVVLPDQVPIHYDFAGNADGWGSKYLNLLFPFATILMGLFFIALRAGRASKADEARERVFLTAGCGTLALFDVMAVIFLSQAYLMAVKNNAVTLDISRILCATMGLVFIVLGNILPKLRKNTAAGVRTTWSQKNEANWRVSQVAGGIGFIVTGAALVLGNVFFVREAQSLAFSLFGIILMIPVTLLVLRMTEKRKAEEK